MKTLHVVQNIDERTGGIASALVNLIIIENRLGMESTVLSIKGDKVSPSLSESATVNLLPPSFPVRFSRSQEANNWLKKNATDYDLASIHAIWGILPIETSHILHNLKVPFMIWPHGSLDPFDLQKKKIIKKIVGPILIRPALNKSAAIICASKLEAENIERYGSKTELRVLPLPVLSHAGLGNRERFRGKYNLDDNDFVLLFLSRIDYIKGLNFLIPAIKEISKDYPNIKLVIGGSGRDGYEKKVQAWIERYELTNEVILAGFLSGQDKNDALSGSDCFVLPSRKENFGISVVEALSAGLPVLISRNVYIWKTIIETGGGWACDCSIESIAGSITHILKNPSELKDKRKNAKRSVEQYSPEKVDLFYKKFYLQLIK